jgi:Polysaccharide lyase family 4, domain II
VAPSVVRHSRSGLETAGVSERLTVETQVQMIRIVVISVAAVLSGALCASAYEPASVRDAGTVNGKVLYTGPTPTNRLIIPTKDKDVCGSQPREVSPILLGPENSVQNALVYLKGIVRGKAWPDAITVRAIENWQCNFRPQLQIIPAGQFEIVNSDPVLHNTHGFFNGRTVFNIALPYQGLRVRRTLIEPGLVRVECDAHGWMLGWIYVADNPYYATTDKEGAFTLSDVPPGTYRLVSWDSYTGAVEKTLSVRVNEVTSVTIELKK